MKNMRHIWTMLAMLVVLTCALATTALATDTWTGNIATGFADTSAGTVDDPIEISTGAELAYLAQEVNKGTTAYVSAYYILTDDIDLGGSSQWTPIGNDYSHSFNGTFDGAGHSVTGLYISGNVQYAGLFGRVNGGTVKNVSVSGSITVNISTSVNCYVGGVVGLNSNTGTVENCSAAVTLNGTFISDSNIGGVVGSNSGIVSNCYATGNVTGSGDNIVRAGGVVGNNSGTVANCYATGAVSAIQSGTADAYAGGVVGYSSSSVTNCYATGAVTASGTDATAGGVVGRNSSSTVSDCYWKSDASGTGATYGIGNNGSTASDDGCTSFTGTGTLSETVYSTTDLHTALNAWVLSKGDATYYLWAQDTSTPINGGYPYLTTKWADVASAAAADTDYTLSENDYTIKTALGLAWLADQVNNQSNTFDTKTVTLANDIDLLGYQWTPIGNDGKPFQGTFDGAGHTVSGLYITDTGAMGLIGYVQDSDAVVRNVAVEGTINITTSSGSIHVGGVVGQHNSGTVANCVSHVTITINDNTSTNNDIGGVVGSNNGTVSNCYATGAITVTDNSNGTNYIGGVVGRNSGTVTACYWKNDVDGSGATTGIGSGSGSTTGFSGTGTASMGGYSSLLNALNGWVHNKADTAYCTWAQSDSTPYLSDYWSPDYVVTVTGDTGYTETTFLSITAPGTYNISMAEGKTSSDKCIFIYSTAGDVTLIFNNVTIETYGGTISTQSGYTGTLTIQGVVNVTSTNGKTIDVQYGTLAISDPNTVVTATGGVDTALYATTAPTLSDNLVAKAKASADGTTYDQAVTWSGDTYQYNSSDAKYIQIAYEAPASTSSGSSSSVTKYTSTVTSADNGSISVSNSSPTYGTTVTVTATPDEGYEVGSITVTNAIGTELTVTDNGDGTYSYKQLGSKVTITVAFVAIETEVEEEEEGALPFTDLDESEYYMDAIAWAVENGITTGKTDTTFAPQDINTRAQAVTFLWRAMGSPESSIENPFTDLDEEEYYYEAVLWAVEMGITVGTTDSTFSPDTDCTRAHIITFLWRTMEQLMADTENPFTDLEENEYYVQAVLWAVENAITTGTTETTFSPYNDCTRAQIITFLYRCLAE